MTERQATLLKHLIETYIDSAEPVASALLAQSVRVSSATVRNDMANLETDGFIEQPHTSAGRVPTIKGYQHYLASFLQPQDPSIAQKKLLDEAFQADSPIRSVAKVLADEAGLAVMVALSEYDFYYTGLSRLFAQPEFMRQDLVISISSVLDALDEALREVWQSTQDETRILLGEENPFSPQTSLILRRAPVNEKQRGLIGILGPTRLNYHRTTGLIEHATMTLTNHYT